MKNNKNNTKGRGAYCGITTGNTIRFGISSDARLLEKFDGMIAEKGYANRSEAIRDLIRDQLVEFAWMRNNDDVVGTLTIVYDHQSRKLTERLAELQQQNHTHIISSLVVLLDDHNCLEVLVIRGKGKKIKRISEGLIGIRGVKHGKLTMSTTGKELY